MAEDPMMMISLPYQELEEEEVREVEELGVVEISEVEETSTDHILMKKVVVVEVEEEVIE